MGSRGKYGMELIREFSYAQICFRKYRSTRTGMTVCLADVESPLVNGFFTVATEANDHDGLPHTLEHLVFMGSEDYPYKGVLDLLANRCLAQGTNAWTDVDHTAYTLATAGSEGFLRIMPVFLEHLLYPTITDEAFLTEVHHINEKGEDAGVVYAEMEGRENTGHSVTERQFMETLFPETCGYSAETGGKVLNLRSLTVDKVRKYHKDYYRPENLCVIVTGKVQPEEVFESLEKFEDKIIAKGSRDSFTRPWMSPVPPLMESVEKKVQFAADDEDGGGIVYVGWRGTNWKDMEDTAALISLWTYLTDTAVSPVQKDMVQIQDPYCGKVRFNHYDLQENATFITFTNVPTSKLDSVKPKFFEVLQTVKDNGFDMKRMRDVIKRRKLQYLNAFEEDPHHVIATRFIGDFLYGEENGAHLEEYVAESRHLDALLERDESYWSELLDRYALSRPNVTIVGEPNKQYGEELSTKEKERVAKQREEFGDEKLHQFGEMLEKATEANEMEPPEQMIESFAVPDVDKISFIDVKSYRNSEDGLSPDGLKLKELLDKREQGNVPFFFQIDSVRTNFLELTAFMDATYIPKHLQPYIELYLEAIYECPIENGERQLSHEEVVSQLSADSVSTSNSQGLHGGNFNCGPFSQYTCLKMKFESEKSELAFRWMKEMLFDTLFTEERLRIAATKLVNDVARYKREAVNIVRSSIRKLTFNDQSCHKITNFAKQYKFLKEVLEKLDTEPQKVMEDMNEFRKHMTRPENLRLHVICYADAVPNVKNILVSTFKGAYPASQEAKTYPVSLAHAFRSDTFLNVNENAQGVVVPLSSTDSGYLIQVAKGPTSFDDPDIPALKVLIECLVALEGPMWRRIRGLGLSYSYGIRPGVEVGQLMFILFRSTSLVAAYQEGWNILNGYLSRETELDEVAVESSKSGVIFEIISGLETNFMAAEDKFLAYMKGVDENQTKKLLHDVDKVSKEDILRVMDKYLRPLFDSSQTLLAICCNPNKAEDVHKEFANFRGEDKVKVVEDIDEYFLE